jgi:hypothetical protein
MNQDLDGNENAIEIAPLILAYDEPISLRFRSDEKRFEIDGAYNIRYEILKKRIDKATIRGKNERLTQPGHIAIVYTQESESTSYIKHLNYLTRQGQIDASIEQLLLEPLQGLDGLRALRVKVKESF